VAVVGLLSGSSLGFVTYLTSAGAVSLTIAAAVCGLVIIVDSFTIGAATLTSSSGLARTAATSVVPSA